MYVWRSFFLFRFLRVVNYRSVKWDSFSADWLGKQNLKKPSRTSTSQVVTVMKWKINVRSCNLCLFIIFFLLKWDIWNHFVPQNVMMNLFLLTHRPKTSDWCFTWQNGYRRCPLLTVSLRFMISKSFCILKLFSSTRISFLESLFWCYFLFFEVFLLRGRLFFNNFFQKLLYFVSFHNVVACISKFISLAAP